MFLGQLYHKKLVSGVPDIYATWSEAGYVDPTVEEQFGNGQPNRTIVTLPLVAKENHHPNHHPGDEKGDDRGDNKREDIILDMMRENPMILFSNKTLQSRSLPVML